jgi:frataxin-like iron-binding protein CyaY
MKSFQFVFSLLIVMISLNVAFYSRYNIRKIRNLSKGWLSSPLSTNGNKYDNSAIQNYLNILDEHQAKATRMSLADEALSVVHFSNGYGTLSTISQQFPGFPGGSVVGFNLDMDSKPFFFLSCIASHTKDLRKNDNACLVVSEKGFQDAEDGRVIFTGKISQITDPIHASSLRDGYHFKHKNAYWIDFE